MTFIVTIDHCQLMLLLQRPHDASILRNEDTIKQCEEVTLGITKATVKLVKKSKGHSRFDSNPEKYRGSKQYQASVCEDQPK